MTRNEADRQEFLREVLRHNGKPYIWAGQGDFSVGYDCSGLAVEGFRACGHLRKREDLGAAALYEKYVDKELDHPGDYREGCLAFWIDQTGEVSHTAILVTPFHVLTADGGGSQVKTEAAAKARDAAIRVLPLDHRGKVFAVVDPFMS